MKTIRNFNVINKRVLVRCDFDVLSDEQGNVLDDSKIIKSLPTIKYLLKNKAKIILMGCLGEPGGKVAPALKLDKVAGKLSEYLNCPVMKEGDCVGPQIENRNAELKVGEILILENLKFHKEETAGDIKFAEEISWLGDIYINDDFGSCDKFYASVTEIPKYLPAGIGLLLEEELNNLNKILKSPVKPFVAIIGGEKSETKLKFIDRISELADCIIVNSLIKEELAIRGMMFKHKDKIMNPYGSLAGMDIDGEAIKLFCDKISKAKTILWTGPFGKIEDEQYKNGTTALAEAIIKSGAFSVVSGEKTIGFLTKQNLLPKFSRAYFGAEAMLKHLSGDKLPGFAVLN